MRTRWWSRGAVLAAAIGAGACATGSTESAPAEGPAVIAASDLIVDNVDGQAVTGRLREAKGAGSMPSGPFEIAPGFHTLRVRFSSMKVEFWGVATTNTLTRSPPFDVCLKALPRHHYTVKGRIKEGQGSAVVVDEATGREVEKTCGLEDDD